MKTLLFVLLLAFFSAISYSQNGLSSFHLPTGYSLGQLLRNDFAVDAQNNKWVAFKVIGLWKLTDTTWAGYDTSNSDIISNTINAIQIYHDTIYCATNKGISIFNGTNWTNYDTSNGLSGLNVNGVFFDGSKLYARVNDTLCVFNGTTWTNFPLNYPAFVTTITKFTKDNLGNIFIGTTSGGLLKFNGQNIVRILQSTITSVNAIYFDSSNRLWFGNANGAQVLINDTTIGTGCNNEILFPVQGYVHSFAEYNSNIYFYAELSGVPKLIEIADHEANPYYFKTSDGQYFFNGSKCLLSFDQNGKLWFLSKFAGVVKVFCFDKSQYNGYELGNNSNNMKLLDINNVKAAYRTVGEYFWDGENTAVYEVPAGLGCSSAYAAGLWVGGLDSNDSLHIATNSYYVGYSNLKGYDFSAGPLDTVNAGTDTAHAMEYDRIWKVSGYEIEYLKQMFLAGNVQNGSYQIPRDIAEWPAHGTGNYSRNLAPFIDFDNDGMYNPMNGDYPNIKGSQMLWWVFNDNLHIHNHTGGSAMGIEVQASAWAYNYDNPPSDSIGKINNQTFGSFKVINRSDTTYHNVYLSIWCDFDLGYSLDDYVGCNVRTNSFYAYNGSPVDGSGQPGTYGSNPPIFSVTFLKGPLADENDGVDNDRDSIIDEPGERIKLSKFIYYNNGSCNDVCEPTTAKEYYNYMRGSWKDGTTLKYGGTGYAATGQTCDFMFPGNSDPNGWGTGGVGMPPWSEETEQNPTGDRRGIGSLGPFTLRPGEEKTIEILYGWARLRPYNNIQLFDSIIGDVIHWYNTDSIPVNDLTTRIKTQNSKVDLTLYPNPVKEKLYIDCPKNKISGYEIFDVTGSLILKNKLSSNYINVSSLSEGMYFVKFYFNNRTVVRKFIK